jgi:uroporphyrin-III C-methyltransferase/precorrin-2 dehydrogenase/sirohydrochlorin ferrochelatase
MQVRRRFWDSVLEGPVAQEVLEGNDAKAEVLLAQALVEHENAPRAALYLIGAGPGHPDLLTVRAVQLLAQADVVLYDHLIPPDTLARYARKEALKLPVGKRAADHSRTQNEITDLIEQHLRANKIVARLKGGDPGIYAHAAEELKIAQQLDVPCQIVPGITAALGCAAMAGIPLTERNVASGVRFLTLYDATLHDENFWKSIALGTSDTLVLYMSTNRRAWLFEKLLSLGLRADLPVLLVEQGTTPLHTEYEATLGSFDTLYNGHIFITPALLIIGDVVRWRSRNGWKEPAAARRDWFQKEAHHARQ